MEFLVKEAVGKEWDIEAALARQARIKVFGIGGAGINMVDWLFKKGIVGAELIAANTDKMHLDAREADKKILLGPEVCRGLGAGGYPEVGAQAAKESAQEIKEALKGTDLLFLCLGEGGGTGTGGAPIVAEIAKQMGSIVIGVVTMPFRMEKARIEKAEEGLQALRQKCDTVIVIDNNRLVEIAGNLPIAQAFAVANELVATMIKGIVETIAIPSLINLDYADVRTILKQGGVSVIGVGESDSENRAEEAVKRALLNPLLDVTYEGAHGALILVAGGPDMTLEEANRAGELVSSQLDPDALVIWGARIQNELAGKMRIMTIITGVRSPYVLGPVDYRRPTPEARYVSEELGIQII